MFREPTVQLSSLSASFAQLHTLLSQCADQAIATRLLAEIQANVAEQLQAAQTEIGALQRQLGETAPKQPGTVAGQTRDYTYQLMMQAEDAARIGGWELLLDTFQFYGTETLYHIFEVPLASELTSQTIWEFQLPAARAEVEAAMQTCMATGEPCELEVTLRTYTGRQLWVRLMANVDYRAGQKRLYGSIQDISSFKETEQALQESELRFRQLTEHITSVFWLTEATPERLLYVSPSYEEIWGRPRAALLTTPYDWLEAVHPEDRERVFTAITTSQTRGGYNEEFRLVLPDGTIRWVRDRSFPIFDENGDLYRIAGLTEDITLQRQNAEALRESEERFRQLAENINQAFWLADQTQVLYVSPAYEKIWGKAADHFYADPWQWLTYVHPDDRARVRAAVEFGQTHHHGEYDEEYRIIRADGALRWIHDRAFPILNEQGQMIRIAGLAADITAQKRQRDAMQLLLECAHVTGMAFFDTLVSTLAEVLDMPQVLLCEVDWQRRQLQTIAVWDQGERQPNFQFDLQSGGVIETILGEPRSYAHNVTELFPHDVWLHQAAAKSCVGAPLRTIAGKVIGCLLALSPFPNTETQVPVAILEIFAGRAVNELERQQAETAIKTLNLALEARVNERTTALAEANAALQLREQQLRQIIDLVPHQLFVQDLEGRFILANQATADHYHTTTEALVGKTIPELDTQSPSFNLTIQDDLALMRTGRQRVVHLQKMADVQGNLQILQTTIVPFVLSGIETPGVIGISIDITEQKRIEEELRRSEAQQRALLDAMPDLFFRISRDGYFLDYSTPPGIPTIIPSADIVGSHVSTLPLPAEALMQSLIAYEQAIVTGEIQTVEYSAMSPEGIKFYESRVVRSGPDEVVSIVRDITQRVKAEAALQQLNEELEKRVLVRTRELEIANQELESFSYSVSHDLRAPLRAINGFSQALLEDYSDQLDSEGLNYLDRVRAASQRMSLLIDDLLTLARVTRQEIRQAIINLSELATAILAELQASQPTRTVHFTVEPGLEALGDPNLITIVLDNLLHNAWKYTSKHAVAHIQFGSLTQGDKLVYFVQDDGAGFDMQYASKLFGAFQRLHNQQDFEGTGVGLATVQRIIHRHGGRVWAEGAVEQGAAFYFTLPTSQ